MVKDTEYQVYAPDTCYLYKKILQFAIIFIKVFDATLNKLDGLRLRIRMHDLHQAFKGVHKLTSAKFLKISTTFTGAYAMNVIDALSSRKTNGKKNYTPKKSGTLKSVLQPKKTPVSLPQ